MHEYASNVTTTPKAKLFCTCKSRKLILSQNFKFLAQKIGRSTHHWHEKAYNHSALSGVWDEPAGQLHHQVVQK